MTVSNEKPRLPGPRQAGFLPCRSSEADAKTPDLQHDSAFTRPQGAWRRAQIEMLTLLMEQADRIGPVRYAQFLGPSSRFDSELTLSEHRGRQASTKHPRL